jgi:ABC-2 type transport system ATP-binding protein
MYAIKTTKLEKKYKDFQALKQIDFEVKSWDFFALLWVNWAWKTTIIWIITDLVKKTSGKVEIFWIDIDNDFSNAKRMIWVVPQEFNLDIFSRVIDVLVIQWWYFWMTFDESKKKWLELLKELWLYDKKDNKVIELSGWMKRRLMIARALVHSPKLLILDEPTAWIDINLRKSTYEFLTKLNKSWTTILLTTHYLEEVEKLCNSLAVIKNGEIIINSSKKEFFAKMEKSKFEVELEENIKEIPENLKKYDAHLKDGKLILQIEKTKSLNELFKVLLENNIKVKNIQNITNELEELFETLTK